MRLPGTGGIPDVTTYSEHIYLYVPRHSRVTFVEQCDFISGMGHVSQRRRGCGPRYLISDLGQFDWASGRMRLTHLHPGITVDHVLKKTGFSLEIAPDLLQTAPPTAEELHLLREAIDPLGVRKLETLSGSSRRQHLRTILEKEGTL
jgi:acyl CoA:acetate/3-ketoacid CoA transferase beta subunit